MLNTLWRRVRSGTSGARFFSAYMALALVVAMVSPGLAVYASEGDVSPPGDAAAPVASPAEGPVADVVVQEPAAGDAAGAPAVPAPAGDIPGEAAPAEAAPAEAAPAAPPAESIVVAAAEPLTIAAAPVLAAVSFSKTFDQFANKPPVGWIYGNLNSSKSTYKEGMSVPQRLILNAMDTGGGHHFVEFQYQFTKGGKYAYDFMTSWNQAKAAASNIAGQTWSDSMLWLDISPKVDVAGLQGPYVYDVPIGSNVLASAKETAYSGTLGYGARTLRIYANAALTNPTVTMNNTLDGSVAGDSKLGFTVGWDGPATTVMIVYGAHIANGLDPYLPHSGIGWGAGMGATGISGSPYHNQLASSSEWTGSASMDNQLQADSVEAMSGITGKKFNDVDGDGTYPPEAGELGLAGWEIWVDLNNNGTYDAGVDKMTTTIADGTYGLYFFLPSQATSDVKVREVAQPSWTKTYPVGEFHLVTVSPSEEKTGYDFGNWLDLKPAVDITKIANPTAVPETGGSVTFTFRIINTGPEAFTVTSLTDDRFGNLLPTAKAQNGGADIVIPSTNPDSYYEFTYTTTLASDSLTPHTNVVTVVVADGNADTATDFASATVTFTDVPPVITVTKTANPTHVPEGGGYVTFTVTVSNPGPEDVTLTSLVDDVFGDLTLMAATNITLPQTILIGGSYSGWFTVPLASDTLTPHTNTVTATAVDDEGTPAYASDPETVTFDNTPPTIAVTKTPNPAHVPETGGSVTFTYRITNTCGEAVTVTSIIDDKFGDLLPTAKAQNGGADIVIPATDPDSYYEFTYTTTLASDSLTAHTNHVDVVAYDNDESPAFADASATVTFDDVPPEITVVKTANPTTVPETGGDVTFTITVENTGTEPVTLTDAVDTVFGSIDVALFDKTYLLVGEIATYSFVEHLASDTLTPHHDVVTVTAVDNDETPDSDSDDATVTFTDILPSLTVAKAVTPPFMILPGGTFNYTATVTNTSPEPVQIISVVDDVAGTIYQWTEGDPEIWLAVGGSRDFNFTIDHTTVGTFVNKVTAIVADNDGNSASGFATAQVVITHPAIDVEKTSDAPPEGVVVGTLVTYTYVVKNVGDVTLFNVVVEDDKLGIIGTIDELAVGASKTFTKSTTLTDGVTNVVVATGYDSHENKVTDSDTVTVETFLKFTELDLAITKVASRATANPGDLVTYTLTYWNNGETAATNFTIVDDFDERYVTITDAGGGAVAGGKITWTLPGPLSLADGKKTISYTVRVIDAMPDGTTAVDNVVVITHPSDADTSNNTARAHVGVTVEEPFLPFTGAEYLLLLLAAIAAGTIGLLLRFRPARDS